MIGQTFAHFKITAKLGEGGMGEVYLAEDTKLGREVAIKVLPAAVAQDPKRLARFEREAKVLASLNHPNIAAIYSLESTQAGTEAGLYKEERTTGTEDGLYKEERTTGTEDATTVSLLVMELVKGKRLADLIPAGGMALERFFSIAAPMADALAAAHESGVVHRDLKPANVMVSDDGRVKVLDFGLAKLQHEAPVTAATQLPTEPLTQEGRVLGTVPYMSPEQLEGQELDVRSDIFSIGVIFYEMAMGERPFVGDSSATLISSIMRDTPGEVDSLRADIPHHLGRIVRRCLEKDPRRRYQSALDVHNELQDLEKEMEAFKLTSAVTRGLEIPDASAGTPAMSRRGLWAAASVVILLVVTWAFWSARRPNLEVTPEKAPSAVVTATPSIAVLPFADMSPDQDQQYFSDGLSEELLNLLARTEGLRVAARTSSFSFRGEEADITTIAESLGVANLLEGSVRKAGNQVRITAQLINAADGFHLWSNTYDRQLDDIFAVQDEIARSVVGALQLTLLGDSSADPPSRSQNVEAYNLYLQGKFFAQRRLGSEDYERAVDYLERAVALDPDYALAWAGLAYALNNQTGDGYTDYDLGHARAIAAVQKALELDRSLAEGWAILGEIKTELEWDWVGADEALTRARQLDPDNPGVIRRQAELAHSTGELERAIELARLSTELDPLSVLPYNVLASAYLSAGRLDEAEKTTDVMQALSPNGRFGLAFYAAIELARGRGEIALEYSELVTDSAYRKYYRALAFYSMGRESEAEEILKGIVDGQEISPLRIAEAQAFMGNPDQAFEWLERAYDQRDTLLEGVKIRPRLANLHGDPRWESFLEKMNLAP